MEMPDITMQSWRTAAYPYQSPDAPEVIEDEAWDDRADDWEEAINELI